MSLGEYTAVQKSRVNAASDQIGRQRGTRGRLAYIFKFISDSDPTLSDDRESHIQPKPTLCKKY